MTGSRETSRRPSSWGYHSSQRSSTSSVRLCRTTQTIVYSFHQLCSPPGLASRRTDVQIRGRLHQLNGRLSKVETQVQLIEQTLSSVDQQDADGNPLAG